MGTGLFEIIINWNCCETGEKMAREEINQTVQWPENLLDIDIGESVRDSFKTRLINCCAKNVDRNSGFDRARIHHWWKKLRGLVHPVLIDNVMHNLTAIDNFHYQRRFSNVLWSIYSECYGAYCLLSVWLLTNQTNRANILS